MEYDNKNRGALFPVKAKKSDKSPDFSGNVNVGGVEYDLSGWKQVSRAGAHYLSLSIKPKGELPAAKPQGDDQDEIPW